MQPDTPPATGPADDFRDGMPFLGGALWLDLLNTTPAFPEGAVDYLAGRQSCADWLAAAGLPGQVDDVGLEGLRNLRAALHPAYLALQGQTPVPQQALETVNALLAGQRRHLRLDRLGEGLTLTETVDPGEGGAAARIAEDFARFLSSYEPERLKCCDNPACNLVFYDRGKSRRRRWCSMAACGNRDKVARFRKRHTAD